MLTSTSARPWRRSASATSCRPAGPGEVDGDRRDPVQPLERAGRARAGHDDGALGASPLDELAADLRGRPGRLLLFVDARDTRGVATQVRDLWSAWFQAHRDELDAVHVLSATPLVQLNLGLGRQLSRTGDLMRLHTDPAEFDRALAAASGG